MRAVLARGFGGVEVLQVAEAGVPATGPGQVRIRVEAATVNPVDLATRSGALTAAGLLPERDVTGLGWDVAGVVAEAGEGVSGFAVGDRVVGLSDRLDVTLGTHADQVVLDATAVARAPAAVPAAEAATLPLNGLTAVQALDRLGLGAGQSLLVTGAAGGVGGFAVQLAVERGLRVIAVAGEDDEELVRAMGAEWFVPRSAPRLGTAVRELVPGGTDGAVDAAALGAVALDAVCGGGAFAALVAGCAPAPLRGTNVFHTWIRADGARLADLVALAEAGRLTLRVTDTLPLEQVAVAHERVAKGGLRGRVVLVP